VDFGAAGQADGAVNAAALALFAAEKDRIQRALARNFAAVSAKRKAEAQGLIYDYATGRVTDPAAAAQTKKRKQYAAVLCCAALCCDVMRCAVLCSVLCCDAMCWAGLGAVHRAQCCAVLQCHTTVSTDSIAALIGVKTPACMSPGCHVM